MESRRDPTAPPERIPAGEHPNVDADADRPVDDDTDDDLTVPLDTPFETPTADLIDQLRSVPLDESDER